MSRDYGRVRAQFWESESLRGLSVSAKFLALYLLTSPHTNAIGCFRLPIAYIGHDTGLVGQALERALAELRAANFAIPCERVPWVWIPNYLKHNPPENPNVWRKCLKELEALPGEITASKTIAAELCAISEEERMGKPESKNRITTEERERLIRFGNGFDTVPQGQRPLPSPIPCPIPEPNQTILVADAPRSKPPTGDFDQFWVQCPKKVGKGKAKKAYAKAILKTSPATIQTAITRYAASRAGQPEEYTAHPATWLNDERWFDDLGTGPPSLRVVVSDEVQAQEQENLRKMGIL